MSTLNITENSFSTTKTSGGTTDPIDKAIDKYKFHTSIERSNWKWCYGSILNWL